MITMASTGERMAHHHRPKRAIQSRYCRGRRQQGKPAESHYSEEVGATSYPSSAIVGHVFLCSIRCRRVSSNRIQDSTRPTLLKLVAAARIAFARTLSFMGMRVPERM